MESYKNLLLANKAWVQEKLSLEPGYFEELSQGQQPTFLWIGCSDSRVPAEEVTGTAPGEIFVHRNIANLVVHTDLNVQSVLHYGIEVLKVNHVIVCGHYGCGGVRAAVTKNHFGPMDQWLRNIKDVFHTHKEEISAAGSEEDQLNRLVELNVLEQVNNIKQTRVLQRAWHFDRRPTLHGWVFGLHDGLLRNLYRIEPGSPVEAEYQYDLAALEG
ncbi:MAG: carbonic anhydrase [Proteobacteria bacterium]|nr:carbonic anhydrase [Pseudomonadota bacterium]